MSEEDQGQTPSQDAAPADTAPAASDPAPPPAPPVQLPELELGDMFRGGRTEEPGEAFTKLTEPAESTDD